MQDTMIDGVCQITKLCQLVLVFTLLSSGWLLILTVCKIREASEAVWLSNFVNDHYILTLCVRMESW